MELAKARAFLFGPLVFGVVGGYGGIIGVAGTEI
jgi:hypothetical protein